MNPISTGMSVNIFPSVIKHINCNFNDFISSFLFEFTFSIALK